jgi:hypothetical protein
VAGYKFFAADDARIRKIARTVPETIASAEFKVPVTLLFENLVLLYTLRDGMLTAMLIFFSG